MRYASHIICSLLLSSAFAPGTTGLAQRVMYPEKLGKVKELNWDPWPSWMSFDMELRSRTEEQTALGYFYGKDRLYDLTRVRGGVTARPFSWLTAYLQFQDAHALGLPLRDVASNQRNTFDFRQGYLNFHRTEPLLLLAARSCVLVTSGWWASVTGLTRAGRGMVSIFGLVRRTALKCSALR